VPDDDKDEPQKVLIERLRDAGAGGYDDDDDDDVIFSFFKPNLSNRFRGRTPSFYKQTLPLLFAISQYNYSSPPTNTRTSIKHHFILPLV